MLGAMVAILTGTSAVRPVLADTGVSIIDAPGNQQYTFDPRSVTVDV